MPGRPLDPHMYVPFYFRQITFTFCLTRAQFSILLLVCEGIHCPSEAVTWINLFFVFNCLYISEPTQVCLGYLDSK